MCRAQIRRHAALTMRLEIPLVNSVESLLAAAPLPRLRRVATLAAGVLGRVAGETICSMGAFGFLTTYSILSVLLTAAWRNVGYKIYRRHPFAR